MTVKLAFSLCVAVCLIITGTQALMCHDPGTPLESDRDIINNMQINSTVTFSCNAGYHLEHGGETYVILCEDIGGTATWNASTPKCVPIVCGRPPAVLNADVVGKSFGYKDQVTYTCHSGYETKEHKKSSVSLCSDTGEWKPTATACVALHCKQPEMIHHSHRSGDVFTFGQEIIYTCDIGYHMVKGETTLQCGPAGTWKGQYPQCDLIDCGSPARIKNSGRSMTGTGYGSKVTYTCKFGFHADLNAGSLERICGLNNVWSGEEPACLGELCGDPGAVLNSNRTSSLGELTFRYPEELKYECHKGYVPDFESGTTEVACQAEGKWDINPANCTIVQCKDTAMSRNVELLDTTNVYGTVRRYRCIEGHELMKGNLSRTCLETAAYDSDPPECERVECGMPDAVSNSDRVFDNGTKYKDIITYTCDTGYAVADSGGKTQVALFCQANKQWSREVPVCTRVSCSPADTGVGSEVRNPTEHYFADEARYRCMLGHEYDIGNEIRLCQADKIWTGVAYRCNRTTCGDPGIPDNCTRQGDAFLYEDRVFFECSPGYEITSGDGEMVCSVGKKWNGTRPICSRISCGVPGDVPDAVFVGQDYLYEDALSYTCEHGYEWKATSGSLTRTCKETGFWSKSPICERVSCGVPSDSNGTMKLGTGYQYMDVVNYTCDIGHEKKGQKWSDIKCNADREWVGTRITCYPVMCSDPGPPENATVSGDSFVYDSILTYTCIEGHRIPDGIDKIICLASMNWSNPAPACSLVPGFVPPPKVMKVVKMVDAEGSDTIGMIGLGLVMFELFVLLIIDLPKLWKDMRMMRHNLAPFFSSIALKLAAWRAGMKKEQPTSMTSLRSGASKKTKKKKKKNKRKKETTYELMDEHDGKKPPPPKRGIICSD